MNQRIRGICYKLASIKLRRAAVDPAWCRATPPYHASLEPKSRSLRLTVADAGYVARTCEQLRVLGEWRPRPRLRKVPRAFQLPRRVALHAREVERAGAEAPGRAADERHALFLLAALAPARAPAHELLGQQALVEDPQRSHPGPRCDQRGRSRGSWCL